MIIVAILTILGFLFILVFLQDTWVDKGPTRPYGHSITGVTIIGLAFLQPFIPLFCYEPQSLNRYIFSFIHAFVGFLAFILSFATLYLATYFKMLKDTKA